MKNKTSSLSPPRSTCQQCIDDSCLIKTQNSCHLQYWVHYYYTYVWNTEVCFLCTFLIPDFVIYFRLIGLLSALAVCGKVEGNFTGRLCNCNSELSSLLNFFSRTEIVAFHYLSLKSEGTKNECATVIHRPYFMCQTHLFFFLNPLENWPGLMGERYIVLGIS